MERGEGSNKFPVLGESQKEPNTTDEQNDVAADVACPSNGPTKRGRGRPKGSQSSTKKLRKRKEKVQPIPYLQGVTNGMDKTTDNIDLVRSVMIRFDAIRRRLRQSGMVHGGVTVALDTFKSLNLYTNTDNRVGSVPGIDVGDIFFLWGEMRVVGLHKTPIGLEFMGVQDRGKDTPTAVSVVSSGSNADKTDDPENLIFTGLGKYNDQPSYEEVQRLNLPLKAALQKKSLVRVVRSTNNEKIMYGNIYIYDGLYLVTYMWKEEGKNGFKVLKFNLVRQPDQNPAFGIWKSVDEWKYGSVARPGLVLEDLSLGAENLKVPVVNEFNEVNSPTEFTYVTSLKDVVIDIPPMVDLCTCRPRSCCGSRNGTCACVQRNGGGLPYLDESVLVTCGPMVFECGGSCPCSGKCKNKMIQTGLKFKFEVFKTMDRGWGLRSWDPIRAGSFICEYAGEILAQGDHEEEDDYIFDTSRVYKSFKWNYEPELIGEDALNKVSEQRFVSSSLVISAKKSGNVARFMNHSCSPNVFWQSIAREQNGLWCTHIAFFAMRHIPPLTELTYDYGVSRGNKKKICLCRSKKCSGSFG